MCVCACVRAHARLGVCKYRRLNLLLFGPVHHECGITAGLLHHRPRPLFPCPYHPRVRSRPLRWLRGPFKVKEMSLICSHVASLLSNHEHSYYYSYHEFRSASLLLPLLVLNSFCLKCTLCEYCFFAVTVSPAAAPPVCQCSILERKRCL